MFRPVFLLSLVIATLALSGCALTVSFIRLSILPITVTTEENGSTEASADPDAVLTMTVRCAHQPSRTDASETVVIEFVGGLPAGVETWFDPFRSCTNVPEGDSFSGDLHIAVGDARPCSYEVVVLATLAGCAMDAAFFADEADSPLLDPAAPCRETNTFNLVIEAEDIYTPPNY